MTVVAPGKKSSRRFSPQDPQLQKQLRLLMRANTWLSIYQLSRQWFVILVSAALSWEAFQLFGLTPLTLLLYGAVLVVLGSRQRALECLIHEAVHMNLSRTRRINDLLAWVGAALPLCHNLHTERFSHLIGHHKNFWDEERDPDFRRYREIGIDRLPAASYRSLAVILAQGFFPYVKGTIPAFFLPEGETWSHRGKRLLFWLAVTGCMLLFHSWLLLLLYWIVPFFFTLIPIRYLGEISEHSSLGCTEEFGSTRNNLGWLNQLLFHPCGDSYHLVHHLYPKIPFHKVALAHRLLLQDPVYREAGHHCSSFLLPRDQCQSTVQEMISVNRK